MVVHFIDTSVLCNLVPVPGRDSNRIEVREELQSFLDASDVLILPVTAVIETGNFIANLSDGRLRRQTAERLAAQLRLAVKGQAPYIFHDFTWDQSFVNRFLDGAGSGQSFVEQATNEIGAGDLLILTEIDHYKRRARLPVHLWTRDTALMSYG